MNKDTIGVVVGRFQTPFLHSGHLELLSFLRKNHPKRLVVIGESPTRGTHRDPLFADSRVAMIRRFDPKAHVQTILDRESDNLWSQTLDNAVRLEFPKDKVNVKKNVVIYGGRDSFIPHYHGIFETRQFEPKIRKGISSSIIRQQVGTQSPSADWGKKELEYFQRGIIYAAENSFPRVFPTVDIAVIRPGPEVLLGQKFEGDMWRFPGGFVDPKDESLEMAARRELQEEAPGIEAGDFEFVDSMLVEDWRYKGQDRIMTSFFRAKYQWGHTAAGDDLVKVSWHPLTQETRALIRPYHQPLFDKLLQNLRRI